MSTNSPLALQPRPTIKHIAEMCGVSVATVSYVINGKRKLKPATRERVLRAMEEVNYHPNAVARGLQSRRVHTLGVLFGAVNPIDFFDHPYISGVLRGAMQCAREEGFDIIFFTSPWESAALSAPPLGDGRTDGILAIAPHTDSDMITGLASLRVPYVAVSAAPREGLINVDVDNFAAIEMATRHLLELGHREIAFVNGNAELASHQPRRAGFVAALENAGLEPRADWMFDSNFDGKPTFEQARAFLQDARAKNDAPTAICAANDYIALGILKAAQSLNIEVPGELSVVGFDDVAEAQTAIPALTTLRQPLEQIGRTATQILIQQLSPCNSHTAHKCLLAPEFIVRQSTAPPMGQSL